jgi:mono/diheme cytochrome c family protein
MTDEALNAIAVYRLSLKPAEQQWPPALASNDVRMTKDNCAACHLDGGTGSAGLFPRLAGSPAVRSDVSITLIRTLLFGSQAAATPRAPTAPAMLSVAWRLSDTQATAVVTYIRNAWGDAAAAVSPDQVRTIRGK